MMPNRGKQLIRSRPRRRCTARETHSTLKSFGCLSALPELIVSPATDIFVADPANTRIGSESKVSSARERFTPATITRSPPRPPLRVHLVDSKNHSRRVPSRGIKTYSGIIMLEYRTVSMTRSSAGRSGYVISSLHSPVYRPINCTGNFHCNYQR